MGSIKPVKNIPNEGNKVYGVDTDAYNPDGLLVVETVSELAQISAARRTPKLRVRVLSTGKFYKVNPANQDEFLITTFEDVRDTLTENYSKEQLDAKFANIEAEINSIKGDKGNESEEFITLRNQVTSLLSRVFTIEAALAAKVDTGSIPNLDSIAAAVANILKLPNANLPESGDQEDIPSTPAEDKPTSPTTDTDDTETEQSSSGSSTTGGTTVGGIDIVEDEVKTNTVYWGPVATDNPSVDEIKALNSQEVNTLASFEFDTGSDEDEGYCVFVYPTALGATVTYTNRNNSFTQIPNKTVAIKIDGADYTLALFEYSYEAIPFKLN